MIYEDGIKVIVADASHEKYVDLIINTIREAAKKRGTGIAERTHEYVATKMKEGKAVLALDPSKQSELGDTFVGFSYIETWGNKSYVTTSGLIVHPDYQGRNIAKRIKDHTFTLARVRWPHAKIFSLTSGDAVMKMNTALGQATDGRRCLLERMSRMREPSHPRDEGTQVLHLHGHAV